MVVRSWQNSPADQGQRAGENLPTRLSLLVLLGATTLVALFLDEILCRLFPEIPSHVIFLSNLIILFGILGPFGYLFLLKPYRRLIAEYRRTTDALNLAERFSRATLDALPDHIAILDARGKILAVNRGWRRFAEENGPLTANVNEGADYFAVCLAAQGEDAPTAAEFAAGIQAVLRGEQKYFSLEYPCHSPEKQRWFSGRVTLLQDKAEPRVVVSHSNITARKLVEEALRQSENIYRAVFETGGNAMLFIAEDGTILRTNSQFTQLTGYPRQEVDGMMNWRSFILPGDMDTMENHNRELWTKVDGSPVNAEIRFVNREGKIRYALMSACRILGTRQSIVSLTDYTVRRAMTQALHENQTKLFRQHEELHQLFQQVEVIKKEWEQTLDCLEDIVVLTDTQGRVRRCNQALLKITGKDYTEALGASLADLLGAMETSVEPSEEGVTFFHPATKRHYLLRTYSYWGGENFPSGNVITFQDITRIRSISRDLAQANRALEAKGRELQHAYDELKAGQQRILQQEKMASLGQLAAGVAHEINNPLGYISSNLGTLAKYLARLAEFVSFQKALIEQRFGKVAELDEKHRTLKIDHILGDIPLLLSESLEGAGRVKKIVQDLKSFSRSDDEDPVLADLEQCLESTLSIVWNEIKYKAELVRDYEKLPRLLCHPLQLGQVFMNLLVNAAQAIDKHGIIKISTRHDGDRVSVAISDTGCGIAPEHLPKLFDPFFTTKEVGKGTGLGLSIAYEIVKKHGGEIQVESTPGIGSTFTLRLPLTRPATQEAEG